MESVGANVTQTDWRTLTSFSAKTTLQDKVFRAANIAIFATALYSVGVASLGIVSYCAYALVARKVLSVVLGFASYQAGLASIYNNAPNHLRSLQDQGYTVREISLEKGGTIYPAYVITHPDTENNGKWTVNAFGNMMVVHEVASSYVMENCEKHQSNSIVLMGYSPGLKSWPTRYQLGAGFEAALQFLEDEVKAKKIVMKGLSLGGGLLSEAVLQHDFKKEGVEYLFAADRTFECLSSAAAKMFLSIAKPLFLLTGQELDCREAAKKLSQHNIKQIVIQHISPASKGSDEVIPDSASLAPWLQTNPLNHKTVLLSEDIYHNGPLPSDIQDSLDHEVNQFFGNSSTG